MQDYELAAQELAAMVQELGLAMAARFIPYSQSSNAESGWKSLNWACSIMRNGKPIEGLANVDYGQGIGYCPAEKRQWEGGKFTKARAVALEIETGKIARPDFGREPYASSKPIPAPSIADVMASLCHDADVLDYASFEQWATEFGYEADSRKAEAIYRACLAYGLALRAAIGSEAMAKMQELANRL